MKFVRSHRLGEHVIPIAHAVLRTCSCDCSSGSSLRKQKITLIMFAKRYMHVDYDLELFEFALKKLTRVVRSRPCYNTNRCNLHLESDATSMAQLCKLISNEFD